MAKPVFLLILSTFLHAFYIVCSEPTVCPACLESKSQEGKSSEHNPYRYLPVDVDCPFTFPAPSPYAESDPAIEKFAATKQGKSIKALYGKSGLGTFIKLKASVRALRKKSSVCYNRSLKLFEIKNSKAISEEALQKAIWNCHYELWKPSIEKARNRVGNLCVKFVEIGQHASIQLELLSYDFEQV